MENYSLQSVLCFVTLLFILTLDWYHTLKPVSHPHSLMYVMIFYASYKLYDNDQKPVTPHHRNQVSSLLNQIILSHSTSLIFLMIHNMNWDSSNTLRSSVYPLGGFAL